MNRVASLVTRREDEVSKDVIGHTPKTEADVKIISRPWYHVLGVRVGRVYLQSLIGLVGMEKINIVDIDGLMHFFIAAAGPAFISLLVNSLELLNKLDSNEHYVAYRG